MNEIINDGELSELDVKLVDTDNLKYPKELKGIPTRINKKRLFKNKVLEAITGYWLGNGWTHNLDSKDESAIFNLIDPITGLCHRSDFAYIVQSERDIYEYEKNK
jgi:hypothetical protein